MTTEPTAVPMFKRAACEVGECPQPGLCCDAGECICPAPDERASVDTDSPPAPTEPVAWRWRPKHPYGEWVYNPREDWRVMAMREFADDAEFQPLYAAPVEPQSPGVPLAAVADEGKDAALLRELVASRDALQNEVSKEDDAAWIAACTRYESAWLAVCARAAIKDSDR